MTALPRSVSEAMESFVAQIRNQAFEEAAQMAILTGNHLSILPPSVRKFPEAGGIIAAKILELRTGPSGAPVDNMWTELNE